MFVFVLAWSSVASATVKLTARVLFCYRSWICLLMLQMAFMYYLS